jgi:predicted N-acetyltransferase YhbS
MRRLAAGKDQSYSLVVVQAHEHEDDIVPARDGFVVPTWVGGTVEVAAALGSRLKKDSVRADLRAIRRERYAYRVTRDAEAIENFHRNMYVPYARQTYGKGAFVWSLEQLRREAPQGEELLLVEAGGQTVAGVYLGIVDKDRLNQLVLGVIDADYGWVRRGVLAAIYYFALVHASASGYSTIWVGSSRPFLQDGVLQFKKKWGMRIVPDPTNPEVLLFRIRPDSAAARSFLAHNPFIHKKDDQLHAAVFLDGIRTAPDDEDPVARARRLYSLPGIHDVAVFQADSGRVGSPA